MLKFVNIMGIKKALYEEGYQGRCAERVGFEPTEHVNGGKPWNTPECCGNACGDCNSSEDDSDCNDDGIPDDCEEIYNEGIVEAYTSGLEEGILIGGQSGDANGDGTLDILDIVYFIDVILYP